MNFRSDHRGGLRKLNRKHTCLCGGTLPGWVGGGGGGGGAQVQRGAAPALRISPKKGSFLRPAQMSAIL